MALDWFKDDLMEGINRPIGKEGIMSSEKFLSGTQALQKAKIE